MKSCHCNLLLLLRLASLPVHHLIPSLVERIWLPTRMMILLMISLYVMSALKASFLSHSWVHLLLILQSETNNTPGVCVEHGDRSFSWSPVKISRTWEVAPKVLSDLHKYPVGGHLGTAKLLHKVCSRFYWVRQRYDVEKWCQDCEICSSRKSPSKPHQAPMQASLSGNPMQRVAMDILGVCHKHHEKTNTFLTSEITLWSGSRLMQFLIWRQKQWRIIFINEFVARHGPPEFL